jgi:hypothetical protein
MIKAMEKYRIPYSCGITNKIVAFTAKSVFRRPGQVVKKV